MSKVTKKEEQVYNYLRDSIEVDGFAPSVRDICRALGIQSTSTVHRYLHSLEAKGQITLSTGKSRAIRLNDKELLTGTETYRVPLLTNVSSGSYTVSAANVDGYVDFPKVMAKGKNNLFALRVVGNGIASSGIYNGDIVIIESGKYLNDGEYIVALYKDNVHILKVGLVQGVPSLKSDEWKDGFPIEQSVILGRLIANFRFY